MWALHPRLPDGGQAENKGDPEARPTQTRCSQRAVSGPLKQRASERPAGRSAPCHTSKVSLHHRGPCRAPPVLLLLLTESLGFIKNFCFKLAKGPLFFPRLHGFIGPVGQSSTKSLKILGAAIFWARSSCRTRSFRQLLIWLAVSRKFPLVGNPSRSCQLTRPSHPH